VTRVCIVFCAVLLIGAVTGSTASGSPRHGFVAESHSHSRVEAATGWSDRRISVRLREAIRQLTVRGETRAGYDRDKFSDWVDADGDCLDTRDEVLRAESTTTTTGGACDVTGGRWVSYYDGLIWRSDDDVDIDHLVALAEAWDSGAKRWNAETRDRYANDLGDARTLLAVTDNVNQSKGDQDVAEWLPPRRAVHCRYVRTYVAVKVRWSLRVDRPERRALTREARSCSNSVLHVDKARIGLRR
jgi:hypothetical protein